MFNYYFLYVGSNCYCKDMFAKIEFYPFDMYFLICYNAHGHLIVRCYLYSKKEWR
jgi:hypothetical protein